MAINWFPGHMLTARRHVTEALAKVDVVIEVLDARVPGASLSPMVDQLRRKRQRPALRLLNKSDLADPHRTRLWLEHFNAQPGVKAVALSARSVGDVRRIPDYCRELAPHRGTRLKPLRLMILGIPNVGKSSLMNALLRRHVAKVGNEPAVTKHLMRHELGPEASLIDTPGMLWPGLSQDSAMLLAVSHSIGRNAYDELEVATWLAGFLLAEYPPLLAPRYGEPPEGVDANGLIEHVARRRGLLLKGGAPDIEKAAGVLLEDFRSGTLGRITLEAPPVPEQPPQDDAAPETA